MAVAATSERRLIVTLDRGFGDIRLYPPGTHAGVLVLRLSTHSLPETSVPWSTWSARSTSTTSPAVLLCIAVRAASAFGDPLGTDEHPDAGRLAGHGDRVNGKDRSADPTRSVSGRPCLQRA